MELHKSSDGRKIIELESWEEAGIKIILPRPKAGSDVEELGLELQKIPIEIILAPDSPAEEALGPLAKLVLRPVHCPHGHPDSIDVTLECDTPAIHFSYLVFAFDAHDHFNDPDYDAPPWDEDIEDGG